MTRRCAALTTTASDGLRVACAALAAWACAACNAGQPAGEPPMETTARAGAAGGAGGLLEPMLSGNGGSGQQVGAGGGSPSGGSGEGSPIDRQEPSMADTMTPASDAPEEGITTRDRRLWVDGYPFLIRGVCWNPVGAGNAHPEGLDFAGFASTDVPLMAALGVNVVRTYEPLLDSSVLDQLWQSKIYVINSVYPWGGAPPEAAVENVRAAKDHPAILMWAIGNEWNYNGLYTGLSPTEAAARLNEVARLIKAEDPSHPVATIYGELPSAMTIAALPNVDVWGINVYRGAVFGSLFEDWRLLSDKAMFVSEYGVDAYNTSIGAYDPESHAFGVTELTVELLGNVSALHDSGVALGGTVFELADEWWKDPTGGVAQQDVGGTAPGGGPFPDGVFNEEWWGLVDMQREPRPAYQRLQEIFLPYPN